LNLPTSSFNSGARAESDLKGQSLMVELGKINWGPIVLGIAIVRLDGLPGGLEHQPGSLYSQHCGISFINSDWGYCL
jgi:hypothetical protein